MPYSADEFVCVCSRADAMRSQHSASWNGGQPARVGANSIVMQRRSIRLQESGLNMPVPLMM